MKRGVSEVRLKKLDSFTLETSKNQLIRNFLRNLELNLKPYSQLISFPNLIPKPNLRPYFAPIRNFNAKPNLNLNLTRTLTLYLTFILFLSLTVYLILALDLSLTSNLTLTLSLTQTSTLYGYT